VGTQFEVLIVDPDPESRMRLRQATAVCGEFASVKLESSLLEALKMMRDRMTCNIVFISQTFESNESREFVKMARETPYGQYAAYIMVLNGSQQSRSGVASNVSGGVDGFLFQPFSVEALRETTAIAAEVRAKATAARKIASRKLLANAIVPQVEKLFGQELIGTPSPQQKYELKSVVRSLLGAYDNEHEFFDAVADLFISVPPPKPPSEDDLSPIARRRRLRLQEAKKREEEAAGKDGAPETQKRGQGGYFVRRSK
jgi:CheY-like chemotaxis protein